MVNTVDQSEMASNQTSNRLSIPLLMEMILMRCLLLLGSCYCLGLFSLGTTYSTCLKYSLKIFYFNRTPTPWPTGHQTVLIKAKILTLNKRQSFSAGTFLRAEATNLISGIDVIKSRNLCWGPWRAANQCWQRNQNFLLNASTFTASRSPWISKYICLQYGFMNCDLKWPSEVREGRSE